MTLRASALTLTLFVSMIVSVLRAKDVAGPGKVAPTNGRAGSVYGPIAYDPSGNIITVGSDSGISNDYIYDPKGRIVAAAVQRSGNVQSQGYGYDAYGNRAAITGVNAMTYSVDATTNRLGSGSPHYAHYDSVGNMTTWLPPGSVASREYAYDALNMVTKESAQGTPGTSETVSLTRRRRFPVFLLVGWSSDLGPCVSGHVVDG
jgi:YD repeat-containing protein